MCEYEKIYNLLADHIMDCDDDDLRCVLYNTLNYLKTRPPKYVIWRVFSFDVSLIFNLMHICTTYIIILLQFSIDF
ncbi:unnamed protein product [Colias eurytheme]|nr:unnamed protein product [Colias eurytheme]